MARIIALLCSTLIFLLSQAASAGVLLEYKGQTYTGGGGNPNQVTAEIRVGPANVIINGFGVYGQATAAGNVKWVIFDEASLTTPVFLSTAQTVVANPGTFASEAEWYDIIFATDFTLLSGHTYMMGLIADHSFFWGTGTYSPFSPRPSITSNGLTMTGRQGIETSGVIGNQFVNTPTLYNSFDNRFDTSIRVLAPDPVPEPGSLALLGLSLLGLGVIRRRVAR